MAWEAGGAGAAAACLEGLHVIMIASSDACQAIMWHSYRGQQQQQTKQDVEHGAGEMLQPGMLHGNLAC